MYSGKQSETMNNTEGELARALAVHNLQGKSSFFHRRAHTSHNTRMNNVTSQ